MRFVPHKYQQNVINHILSHHGTGGISGYGAGENSDYFDGHTDRNL